MNNTLITKLKDCSGSFAGRGLNHEGQPFIGNLVISEIVVGLGVTINFKAVGKGGIVYHEELSMVAADLSGEIGLYNLNSNMPGLVHHILKRCEITSAGGFKSIFSFGQMNDSKTFREEITLEFDGSESVEYKYAWGIPGGDFAHRSGAVMKRT